MPDESNPHSDSAARGLRVAVIGGGLSGLVAARETSRRQSDATVELYEQKDRVGGSLQTTRHGDWLIEHSADMMVTRPDDGFRLCQELGMEDQMLPTNASQRGALIYRGGRLYPVPDGFSLMAPSSMWAITKSRLLSWRGKLRLARERWIPPRLDVSDESFESFALRRCGREAYEYLIQPLVSGIYTADPSLLSMQATSLTRFVSMEKEHGSLARGMMRGQSGQATDRTATGARYSMFTAPKAGMQQFIDRLAASSDSVAIKTEQAVTKLEPIADQRWRIESNGQAYEYDRVILASSAKPTARLLQTVDPQLSKRIGEIHYASCAVVVLAFPQPTRNPGVFGLVVPSVEGRSMIAASFASNKFPGRAPDGGLLVRVFLGGAMNEPILESDDARLIEIAKAELTQLAGVQGTTDFEQVVRWPSAMPQYHVGHLQRVAAIEEALGRWPTLALAGNAYRGVGIPDCVRSGVAAADKVSRIVDETESSSGVRTGI